VSDHVSFADLSRAAYCPRQLYYARREDDRSVPPSVRERRDLANRYDDLRAASDAELRSLPLDRPPDAYRDALDRLAARDDWAALAGDHERAVRLRGKDCAGVASKLLPGTPPTPTFVSPGEPPERGVWEPQRVRAVAMAKALSWERERRVERALVEYPASGVVRRVNLTTGNRALYRRALRAVRAMDGPPPRTDDDARCGACDYRDACGVRTRSLRSLLGL
jgi:CRISPR-associated exonuclease Cas4